MGKTASPRGFPRGAARGDDSVSRLGARLQPVASARAKLPSADSPRWRDPASRGGGWRQAVASAFAMLPSARSTSWRDVAMFIRIRPSLPRP